MKIVLFVIWSNQRTLWSDVINVLCHHVSVLVLFCLQNCTIIWLHGTKFESSESSNPGRVVVFQSFSQYDKKAMTPFVDGYLGVFSTQLPLMPNVHESLKISTKLFNGLPNWEVLGEVLELNYLSTFPNDHTAAELLILILHSHYHLQWVNILWVSASVLIMQPELKLEPIILIVYYLQPNCTLN